MNPIDNPNSFTNTSAYNQEVYARVERMNQQYLRIGITMLWYLEQMKTIATKTLNSYVDGQEIVVGCGTRLGCMDI